MADYAKIVRLRPEVREFIRHRKWVHRGEALVYGPNIRCEAFSTDLAGFRHSTFRGKTLSVAETVAEARYGLVLGASNIYGFGCAGNDSTIPSLLAEQFGFPFANIGLPEGNSRNLFTILLHFVRRASNRPSVVIHLSGGDFTGFCYGGIADPAFGSPNLKQVEMAVQERGGRPPLAQQVRNLLTFSTLWSSTIADLCRTLKIPFLLGDDTTFFEKQAPSETDFACKIGVPSSPAQKIQFDIHHRHGESYYLNREGLAARASLPFAGLGRKNQIGFIDEFHYDREGTRALTQELAKGVELLVR